MNILLMGYYGQRNIGDDLFVKQLTHYFSQQSEVDKIFLLCKEDYYPKTSEKVRFFSESKLSKLQKLRLLVQSDRIFWGGGTLNIDDKPTNLLRMQALCKFLGKSFGFLGIGLEGVGSQSESRNYALFEKADLLYVRDKYSYDVATQTGKNKRSVCLGGDLAFLDLSVYDKFLKNPNKAELKHISFCGKFWWGEGRGEFYAQQLMPAIEKYNAVIHLLPAHVGDERNDNRFHHFLQKYLPPENCQLHSWEKPEEFIEILSGMDFHLGNRLHSIILADILGVPNIGIDKIGSKIENYLEKAQLLAAERRVDFMEEIGLERMERILQEYQRPEEFIRNESEQAQRCLEKIWQ